jgi:3-methyladenine DNA glycosylase AlkC
MGGFIVSIQFERRATLILEQFSATNPNKHIAVAAQWGEKEKETRWLAAPLINRRITDGVLTFTADATREEADEITR